MYMESIVNKLDERGMGFDSRQGHGIQTGSGAHTASYSRMRWALLQEKKRSGNKADHSSPSCAEINNARSYTSIPADFIQWCLIKYGDNSTFVELPALERYCLHEYDAV
jgi:hypothetical protein